jgi:putative flippase GtrA
MNLPQPSARGETARTPPAEVVRYGVAGSINTGASYALYFLLLRVLPYAFAYSIAFVAGIALSYWLNARFVFHAPTSWASALRFPLVYVTQYLVGLATVAIIVEGLGVHPALAALFALLATVPLGFVLTRWCLRRGAAQ